MLQPAQRVVSRPTAAHHLAEWRRHGCADVHGIRLTLARRAVNTGNRCRATLSLPRPPFRRSAISVCAANARSSDSGGAEPAPSPRTQALLRRDESGQLGAVSGDRPWAGLETGGTRSKRHRGATCASRTKGGCVVAGSRPFLMSARLTSGPSCPAGWRSWI